MAERSSQAAIVIDDAHVHHRVGKSVVGGSSGVVLAVDGVSFSVAPGETFGVVGESGSGKSTLARAALGLIPLAGGSITIDGQPVTQDRASLQRLRRRVQMVFQDATASLDPRMTVGELIEEPLIVHDIGTRADRQQRVVTMLEQVGLDPKLATRKPKQLSGGQRQRVGLARALIVEPQVVILDEPVSAVDVSVQAQILNLLSELKASTGVTYLFIVHDLAVAEYFCDRLVVMYRGAVMEEGTSADLFERVQHPYTAALLSAVPVPDPSAKRMHRWIPIDEADAAADDEVGAGCRFRPRCPVGRNDELCRSSDPALVEVAPGHRARCHYPGQTTPVSISAHSAHPAEQD
ncbi:MAG TPA: ATP-binding cassette domain-containing protein [Ilumatobacteraceae bacterium]|nr:ATP-binding cassette domain-containing protein [Ilumatobacteraceae bacterium]